ncbi:rho GTPase-activating protein 39-like isoform X1 [Brienomyrus brachyistius]|uniref:rho GTPase-activating protein 39-like isoform X1 n=2 Tax=Brienomyrus brachyistius TaxID=42636 RepID=UPI0020B19666|nr:rho GTPase-activating protein 39-like isoform X1 [Brienomyrus brachyistius]XP_048879738.1 rho GTPase-activating protein 39-like isoform X1 [Brienomyrus brachyistius]
MAETSADWVEILEPRSRRRMYVNLTTGECGWEPPRGATPRPADGHQWWELFDGGSSRFYYHNPASRRTVWHRPRGSDIVPLARLQAAKRSSEVGLHGRGFAGGGATGMAVEGRRKSLPGNGPYAVPPLQDLDSNRGRETPAGGPADGTGSRKDTLREASQRWHPTPGSKATMLVKVHSMGPTRLSGHTSAPALHQRRSSSSVAVGSIGGPLAVPYPVAPASRAPSPADARHALRFLTVDGGSSLRPPTPGLSTSSPASPSLQIPLPPSPRPGTEAPSSYDDPPEDLPVYDEPPADMEVEGATPTFLGPSSKTGTGHRARSPSTADYSPAGRACIRHMVNVELAGPRQSSLPRGPSVRGSAPPPVPGPTGSRGASSEGPQSWKAGPPRSTEGRHNRQGSLALQERPPGVGLSYQDSGYSTGPSPGQRRKSRRRPPTGQGWGGSIGGGDLGALNDRLVAEMRARSSCLGPGAPVVPPPPRSPPRSLHGLTAGPSPEDGAVGPPGSLARRHCDVSPTPTATADGAGGHKRTYEKVDTLEKGTNSQSSLCSPESPSGPTQAPAESPGPLETSGRAGASSSRTEPLKNGRRGGASAGPGTYPPACPAVPPPPDTSMTDWATKHLNMQKRGLFRRRVSLGSLLSWSGAPLRAPMLITSDRTIKREACEIFRLVQAYMGDRPARLDRRHAALLVVSKCWVLPGLRDELYVQLVRQTTHNQRPSSLAAGWELMAISLGFFAPSPKFRRYLEGYIQRHLEPESEGGADYAVEQQDMKNKKNSKSRKKRRQNVEEGEESLPISTYAKYCYRKLQKVVITGGKKGLRKPTLEEIEHSRKAIVTPSLFGSSLEEVMERQQELFPDRRLPWVQVQLSQYVLALGGTHTEGIFRIPGDIDEVNALQIQVDQWRTPENLSDPNVPASLLKLWYRELEEPLIPPAFYRQCVANCEDAEVAVGVVQALPELNRLVLCYFIHFLQIFAQPANVSRTKMDVNNLAMVMAPNCLRCQSEDPRVIFENTRKEMAFLRLLIVHLDTSFIKGVV